MPDFDVTSKNRVARVPERGHYDRADIYPIIDEALICHVGLVQNGEPVVIPTLHARRGDEILLHGATKSRLMQHLQAGGQVCITITLVDGLVLARSIMHHSVNYRSVVLFGAGRSIADDQKMAQLEAFTEKLLPGRWADARQPSPAELKATAIAAVPIELASAKIRQGPPKDDAADMTLPVWAGVLPLRQQQLPPQADPQLQTGIPLPDYIRAYLDGEQDSVKETK